MSKGQIEHEGWVSEVKQGAVVVRIISQSACASCHSKEACSLSEIKDKYVEVPTSREYKTDDRVIVVMRQSLGSVAVLLSYIVPFIVLVAGLLIGKLVFNSDGFAGLSAIGVVLLYFFVLYLFRGRLKKAFEFSLK